MCLCIASGPCPRVLHTAAPAAKREVRVRSTDPEQQPAGPSTTTTTTPEQQPDRPQRRQAGSTDAIASFLTRRFGIVGGLAWLGFLAVGSLGEQVKTRMEVAAERDGTRDVAGQQVGCSVCWRRQWWCVVLFTCACSG